MGCDGEIAYQLLFQKKQTLFGGNKFNLLLTEMKW